jgi:hypothetical protein
MTVLLTVLALAALVQAGKIARSRIEEKRLAARLIPVPVMSDARMSIMLRRR